MGSACSTANALQAAKPLERDQKLSGTVDTAGAQTRTTNATPLNAKQAQNVLVKVVADNVPQSVDELRNDVAGVEEKARAVGQLCEGVASGDPDAAMQLGTDAVEALDAIDGVVSLFSRLWGSKKANAAEVKHLASRPLTEGERALIKYSAIGQVVVGAAGQALSALPFGAPVAALLGAIYARTVQTAKNSQNCNRLVAQIKRCDEQLARVVVVMGKESDGGTQPLSPRVKAGFNAITLVLEDSAALISQYSDRGCVMRFVTSTGDQLAFKALEQRLKDEMQWSSFAMSVHMTEVLASGGQYVDESAALRKAVCEAAGDPGLSPEDALKLLRENQPDKLKALLKEHCKFSDQVVRQELDFMSKRLAEVEKTVAEHGGIIQKQGSMIHHLQMEVQLLKTKALDGMVEWVLEWWKKCIGRRKREVNWAVFKEALQESLKEVKDCDAELCEMAIELGVPDLKAAVGSDDVFLEVVVRPVVDANGDQTVTDSEVKGMMVTAMGYAARVERATPKDMDDLMDILFLGFDRSVISVGMKAIVSSVIEKLKVTSIIQSYNTSALLDNYMPGTRKWMFNTILSWRLAVAAQTPDVSRMFLLLADAGMGKSMCSAVLLKNLDSAAGSSGDLVVAHHFFKVGQARGEGRAMLLCLVQQLCQRLPGLAALVQAALVDLPDLQGLDLQTTFDKLVLAPLQNLDRSMQESGTKPPCCLLVLDALDESDYNNQGYHPVCNLVATSFMKLPLWLCVMVTGRPEIEAAFSAWKPQRIEAMDERNKEDLRIMFEGKLWDQKLVAECDLQPAVNLLLKKSQGQFIYSSYMSQALAQQPSWTLQQLQCLPDGLREFYAYRLTCIALALSAEKPKLVALLRDRLLPVLAVMRQPLSVNSLAWLAKGENDDVALLMELLYALFPGRPGQQPTAGGQAEEVFAPYHKSITDFLLGLSSGSQSAASAMHGDWATSPATAHTLVVSRLLPEVLHPSMQHWRDPCAPQVTHGGYCLQHLLDHIALAQEWTALHKLVSTLPAHKAVLETPGQVFKMIQVLADATRAVASTGTCSSLPSSAVDDLRSVHRFLRSSCNLVVADPHSLLQEVACSPQTCALGTWCQEQFDMTSSAFWQGAVLVKERVAAFPALVATLQGHGAEVNCCALTPDGSTLASGSDDKTLKVWDIATGQLLKTLEGHGSRLSCCALSPDGSTLVSGSHDKTLKVWDLSTGQLLKTLEGHGDIVTCCALSPDGSTLVSGSADKTLKVWDLATGQLLKTLKGHDGSVSCCALSPDGSTLVSGSGDKTLKVWDLNTGQLIKALEGHRNWVLCCALSPDGSTLVSGSEDNTLKVWDLATGQLLKTLEGQRDPVSCCALSPDGSTLVSGSHGNTLEVWDLATGQLLKTLEGHGSTVYCCALSPDGSTLVSGSRDSTLKVWSLATGQLFKTPEGHGDFVRCCALSPDGTTLVSGSSDNTVKVWDLPTGQLLKTLEGHGGYVYCCALSPDGSTLVSGSGDKTLKVWDLATGQLLKTLKGHDGSVSCCALSPDGSTLVSGSDGKMQVWDLATGQLLKTLKGHDGDVKCCALSPDGSTLVSGSRDNTLKVWDLATGQLLRTLEAQSLYVLCCALSPDGRTVVSGSIGDIKVWDLATGQLLKTLEGHRQGVTCCAVSPDGSTLVSGSGDRSLKVWDNAVRPPEIDQLPATNPGFSRCSSFYTWYAQGVTRLRVVG